MNNSQQNIFPFHGFRQNDPAFFQSMLKKILKPMLHHVTANTEVHRETTISNPQDKNGLLLVMLLFYAEP